MRLDSERYEFVKDQLAISSGLPGIPSTLDVTAVQKLEEILNANKPTQLVLMQEIIATGLANRVFTVADFLGLKKRLLDRLCLTFFQALDESDCTSWQNILSFQVHAKETAAAF